MSAIEDMFSAIYAVFAMHVFIFELVDSHSIAKPE